MDGKDIADKAREISHITDDYLRKIAEWNERVPQLKQLKDAADFVVDSIEGGPPGLDSKPYPPLYNELASIAGSINMLPALPSPSTSTGPVLNTALGGTVTHFVGYVNYVSSSEPKRQEVQHWSRQAINRFQDQAAKQRDSAETRRRLSLISQDLAALYDTARDTTLRCSTGHRSASDAAKDQRRVLEQFKGELLALCKSRHVHGRKDYLRIADNLAARTPVTSKKVEDGQQVYKDLHDELTNVMKLMRLATGDRMKTLLDKLNEHILTITGALDPSLTGIAF